MSGSGTAGYGARFTGATSLGNSSLKDDGNGNVGIGGVAGWNAIGWPGSLYVNGNIRAARYYDDDPSYYADLNAGGNLGGSWNFGGNISAAGYIYVSGYCFRPRTLVRCYNHHEHFTWVDNQGECTGAGYVVEQTIVILAQC